MDQPERVRYFDQQFLRVEDFGAEQDYHRDMRRRHNRMLHTPGISEGLLLSADGTGVVVSAGAAVAPGTDANGGGAEIVVAAAERKELSSFAANAAVYVTIAFDQEESRERNDAGVKGFTRWREVPEIELFTSDPTTNPPADATQRLRLLLGRVNRGGASGKEVVGIDASGRRIAGSAESELSLTPRDPAVQEPDWVRLRWLARGQAEMRGSLKLVAAQSSPGDLSVQGTTTLGGNLLVGQGLRGRSLRVDTTAADTPSIDVTPSALSFHRAGTAPSVDPRISSDASGQLALTASNVNAMGTFNVGLRTSRALLNVFGNAVVERGLITMGRTDGSGTTAGEVLGGLGFQGWGVQHGQLSFRAGAGFELVDQSSDIPRLDYAAGSRPYADLRARDVIAAGALRPSAGNSPGAGIQFPADPGGGAGDEAFIRYYAEAGETTKLLIGTGNDVDDRLSFWQAGAERVSIYAGRVGIGTQTPEQLLHVAGNVTAGAAMIGDVGHGPVWAGFCHYAARGAASYGLLQSNDGRNTLINKRSGGGLIEFRVDNGTRMWINDGGDVFIQGRLSTYGKSPNPIKQGWGGGIHTFDVEAEGTIWSRSGYQSEPRDVAENFASDVPLGAGDVVTLDPARDVVVLSSEANDPHVLGVVSEAPAILLGAGHDDTDERTQVPIGLAGRVPCKVVGPVARGDLLTASGEPGHAMRATPVDVDGLGVYRPGTILGKALGACSEARGVIDIIVLSR